VRFLCADGSYNVVVKLDKDTQNAVVAAQKVADELLARLDLTPVEMPFVRTLVGRLLTDTVDAYALSRANLTSPAYPTDCLSKAAGCAHAAIDRFAKEMEPKA